MKAAFLFLLWILTGCASGPEVTGRRACLYDAGQHWRKGTVVASREDGARLFRFDDPTEGDHGFMWIDSEDRSLQPCRNDDSFARGADEQPPLFPNQ